MLTALVRLRGALAGGPAAARAAERRGRTAAARAEMVDQLEDYVIPRLMTDRRAAADRRRRLDRRRQVDAGQLAGRHAGSPSRACCGRRPARRCWCTTPTTREWFGQDRLLPELERVDRSRPTTRTRSSSCRRTPCRPGSRSSTPPTSTRSRSATAPSPPSCSRPPTCGSSSPRPRATPTRCRGSSCARPPSARAAVAIVLDRTPPDAVETVVDPPRPDAREPRPQGLAAVHRHRGRGRRGGPAAARGGRRDPRLARVARRRRRRALRRRPADPRRRHPHAGPPHPLGRRRRRPSRSTPYAACASDVDTAYDEARGRESPRRPPTAPCCAARCSPAGRSSSAPASCSSRWRRGSAGCATGSSTRSRASPSRPSGSPSPSSPAWRR